MYLLVLTILKIINATESECKILIAIFVLFFQSILGPLVQLPMFISFFFAIRGMAYLPVESFKTGGYLWFQDLTLYDPYFVLPFICSFSMLASIEVIMHLKFTAAVFHM